MKTITISPLGSDNNIEFVKTLKRALELVEGETVIKVMPGYHVLNSKMDIPPNVRLMGMGPASIMVCKFDIDESRIGLLNLSSEIQGMPGNNTISGLSFEGKDCTRGIVNWGRSDVEITNCFFQDFTHDGVTFFGNGLKDGWSKIPTKYGERNFLTNCYFKNVGTEQKQDCKGSIRIQGQSGMLIDGNVFVHNLDKANGFPIKAVPGNNKECIICNNNIKRPLEGIFSISVEWWNGLNDLMYNNEIEGAYIDIVEGSGTEIFRNKITSKQKALNGQVNRGLVAEAGVKNLSVHDNYFQNWHQNIVISNNKDGGLCENIEIKENIFEDTGYLDTNTGQGVVIHGKGEGITRGIRILKNKFLNEIGPFNPWYGIHINPSKGKFYDFKIKDNEFKGFSRSWIAGQIAEKGTPELFHVLLEKNQISDCGTNNLPWYQFKDTLLQGFNITELL
jgi:hypothetical protein